MSQIVTLGITGMTCATCSGAIEKLLNPMDGIREANVSLLMNQAVIQFDPAIIQIEAIIEEIEDIGFDAKKVWSVSCRDTGGTGSESCYSMYSSRSRNSVTPQALQLKKKDIVIWSANILTNDDYENSYFYQILHNELCGIIKIIFTANASDTTHQLSIHFDKTKLLPMSITHKLQSKEINLQMRDIALRQPYPQDTQFVYKNREAFEEKEISELRRITFCISNIDAIDAQGIQEEFGDLIESIHTETRRNGANLWLIIEYYDDEDGVSTSRQIYDYLCNECRFGDRITIIDAMSIERDEFQASQIRIVDKIQRQFYLALLFGGPCFVIAMILPHIAWIHDHILMYHPIEGNHSLDLMGILLFLLSSPVQFWIGHSFYVSAWNALKRCTSNMSTLIVLGTTIAWIYSFLALSISFVMPHRKDLHGASHFFETSATVITIVLFGKWLQSKAKFATTNAIGMLMDMQPPFATLVAVDANGEIIAEETISTELVVVGDIISIKRSCRVPLDGTIVYGSTDIDEANITGESIPRHVDIGDRVISSSINCGSGKLLVRVDAAKSDSILSQIIYLMKNSQTNKPKQQHIADRLSSYFVPVVVIVAVLTFVIWFILCHVTHVNGTADPTFFSILFSMAVMVIACPCALGLAVPTAVMVGTGIATKYGTLIKGGNILEIAHHLDIIVFDKTGTLTFGKPKVVEFTTLNGSSSKHSVEQLLYYIGCAEMNSEHPLANAILIHCKERSQFELIPPIEFEAIPGKGVTANVDGHTICIGNFKWFFGGANNQMKIALPEQVPSVEYIGNTINKRNKLGMVSLLIAVDGVLEAYIDLFDAPRPCAKQVIDLLQQQLNINCVMLTGDNENTARAVANAVGIDEDRVISNILPQHKHQVINEIQLGLINLDNKGELKERSISLMHSRNATIYDQADHADYKLKVGMVGDGINDAAALSQADLGIAIGNGTDIAIEAADVILMNDNLFNIAMLIDLSATIIRRIYLNFGWALGFNCLGIPIAAGALYPFWQIRLPPEIAAIAMAVSSLCVLISSISLKTYASPYHNNKQAMDIQSELADTQCCQFEVEDCSITATTITDINVI
eukprot:3798_1